MDKRHIITRQGKEFVLYEGLLDEAHQQGLKRITTTLLQLPREDNGNTAVVSAEVEIEKGVFCGLGDANSQNVNKMILPHIIRMAETRAKARALRDAINVGMTAIEELGDGDGAENGHQVDAAPPSIAQHRAARTPPRPQPTKDNLMHLLKNLASLRGKGEDPATVLKAGEVETGVGHVKPADLKDIQIAKLIDWAQTQITLMQQPPAGETVKEEEMTF